MSPVRPMAVHDLDAVKAVERSAGERFRSLADPRLSRCADDEPFTEAELTPYIRDSRAWVAVEGTAVVGFVIVDILDGCAHIEEIAVAAQFGRRGHGAALLRDLIDTAWVTSSVPAAPRTGIVQPTDPKNPGYNPATGTAPAQK